MNDDAILQDSNENLVIPIENLNEKNQILIQFEFNGLESNTFPVLENDIN